MPTPPNEGAKALEACRKFGLTYNGDAQTQLEVGIGDALHDLWTQTGSHPAEIAAFALEDANYHDEAAALREIARQSLIV